MLTTEPLVPSQALGRAVSGEDNQYDRGRAILQLAASTRNDRETLLGFVVADNLAPRRIRAVAAYTLADLGTPEAEEILLSQVGAVDEASHTAVLRAVSRVGTARALAACHDLRLPPGHPSLRALDWAITLLVHRLGLPNHPIPISPPVPLEAPSAGERRPIAASTTEIDWIDAAERARWSRRLGIGPETDSDQLPLIACGEHEYAVVLDPGAVRNLQHRLTAAPAILAVVLSRDPEADRTSLAYIVLTRPESERTVEIVGYRDNGTASFAGSGTVSDKNLTFDLRAAQRPGARPLLLSGQVTQRGLTLEEAYEHSRGHQPPTQPQRIPPGIDGPAAFDHP